jgi:hypothetical protein
MNILARRNVPLGDYIYRHVINIQEYKKCFLQKTKTKKMIEEVKEEK